MVFNVAAQTLTAKANTELGFLKRNLWLFVHKHQGEDMQNVGLTLILEYECSAKGQYKQKDVVVSENVQRKAVHSAELKTL